MRANYARLAWSQQQAERQELDAMRLLAETIAALPDEAARARVLRWLMDYFGVDRAAEACANAPRPAAPTFEDALLTIPSADELYAGVDPRAREDRLEKRVEPAVAAPRENDDSLEVASLASHFGPRLVVGETTRREAEDDVPATDSVMAEEDVAGDAALAVPADIVSVEADIVVASAPVAAGPETELTELLRSFAAELEALAAAWHAA